jgi:hypothetical protein
MNSDFLNLFLKTVRWTLTFWTFFSECQNVNPNSGVELFSKISLSSDYTLIIEIPNAFRTFIACMYGLMCSHSMPNICPIIRCELYATHPCSRWERFISLSYPFFYVILLPQITSTSKQHFHYISPMDYSSERMDVIVSAPMQIVHIFVFLSHTFVWAQTNHRHCIWCFPRCSSDYVTWFAWSEMADWETMHVCWFWWMVTDVKGLHTDEEWTIDRSVPLSINVDLELVWSCMVSSIAIEFKNLTLWY